MSFNHTTRSIEKSDAGQNLEPNGLLDRFEENRLALAAKGGQRDAFDDLCRAHVNRSFKIAYRITRNREDAKDAAQDSFLSAFIHIRDFDGRSSFSTWLTRIAINSALMIVRKRRSAIEISIHDVANHSGDSPAMDLEDRAPNPEMVCAQREEERILRDAIRSLRPEVRKVIELQKLRGHSVKQTAEMMDVSLTVAKSRIYRGKAALRESLKTKNIRRVRATTHADLLPAA